ncbi:MAG TPA: TetR/AcrR family transcriptional regulator [Micromonosporaceae bacterium]|nr:TetR/AcrR family transcriptional regulator [Micromonosporaceae bacterium]
MIETPVVDGRLARGERTRTAVLDAAVALATEAGLDGLSLGQLAERLGVSKSGLFAHWRSKEELQLAAIEHARAQWTVQVVSPALAKPRGVRRLFALHESRLAFYSGPRALPGGCFFANAEFEYSARPGPVRDRIAVAFGEWLGLLERLTAEAITEGDLRADTDPHQVAYEIEALGMAAVLQARLAPAPNPDPYHRARRAVLDRLRALCADPDLLPEE